MIATKYLVKYRMLEDIPLHEPCAKTTEEIEGEKEDLSVKILEDIEGGKRESEIDESGSKMLEDDEGEKEKSEIDEVNSKSVSYNRNLRNGFLKKLVL